MMKKQLLTLIGCLVGLVSWAQDVQVGDLPQVVSDSVVKPKRALPNQPYLVVDANPALGGFYRYRYFEGDRFKFKTWNEPSKQKVNIYSLADSSFQHVTFSEVAQDLNYYKVDFKDIKKVYTSRRITFITEGAFILPLAGAIYLLADFINPGIDGKRWNTSSSTVAVSSGMVAAGAIFYKMSFKSVRINNRNRLYLLRTY